MVSPLLRGGEVILEIGCGRGEFTKRLGEMARRVVGLDISKEILPDPSEKLPDNVEFRLGDACNVPSGEAVPILCSAAR